MRTLSASNLAESMEIPSLPDPSLLTMEKRAPLGESRKSLKIGVPKEVENEERRVSLSPAGVALLSANDHEVFVETGAGELAHYNDYEYTELGAEVVETPDEVFRQSDVIVKVCPPSRNERTMLRENQVLISALHLGGIQPHYLKQLNDLRITGIGFEFIQDPDGTYPIVRMMHEVTGSMAVQVAARYLESSEGGSGVMLGGISGVPPAKVVILGAGVIGEWAARTALGFGANVVVLSHDLSSLRALEHYLDRQITTAVANPRYIQNAVQEADVVIGAVMQGGARAPQLVTETMVKTMRRGAVIVDAVIDQGGCVETSRPTTHSNPVFTREGVVHYCVPNMPSNAARTSSEALTNVLVPYVLEIGEAGSINDALWRNEGLRTGTYVYRGHLTKKSIAALFGMAHRDIELLIASGI